MPAKGEAWRMREKQMKRPARPHLKLPMERDRYQGTMRRLDPCDALGGWREVAGCEGARMR